MIKGAAGVSQILVSVLGLGPSLPPGGMNNQCRRLLYPDPAAMMWIVEPIMQRTFGAWGYGSSDERWSLALQ